MEERKPPSAFKKLKSGLLMLTRVCFVFDDTIFYWKHFADLFR